jgi:DNA damage-binding protein 1
MTFENISSYQLDANEEGISILSCSFIDDNNVYCCVGTTYCPDKDNIYKKGRILVFLVVGDRQLCLVSEKETKSVVYTLNAFNGKLLAGIDEKIELYKLVICDDGSRELEYECGHPGLVLALCVKTRGYFILVGDYLKSMYLLVYKHEQGGMLEERARDYSANWMTAVEFLDDDIYLGAESNFNIFTAKKNNDAAINDEDQGNSSFLSVSE